MIKIAEFAGAFAAAHFLVWLPFMFVIVAVDFIIWQNWMYPWWFLRAIEVGAIFFSFVSYADYQKMNPDKYGEE